MLFRSAMSILLSQELPCCLFCRNTTAYDFPFNDFGIVAAHRVEHPVAGHSPSKLKNNNSQDAIHIYTDFRNKKSPVSRIVLIRNTGLIAEYLIVCLRLQVFYDALVIFV